MRLNGQMLHSVPTMMTVIDPAGQFPSLSDRAMSGGDSNVSATNPLMQALTPALLAALTKETQAIHTGGPVSAPVSALKALFLSIGGITVDQANGLVACASVTASQATDAGIGYPAMQANVLNAIAKAAAVSMNTQFETRGHAPSSTPLHTTSNLYTRTPGHYIESTFAGNEWREH